MIHGNLLPPPFPAGTTIEIYLLSENIRLLPNILYYHIIIDGLHSTPSLVNGNLTTLNGDAISVVVSGRAISFNDAYVLEPDLMFDNGIVHTIDFHLIRHSSLIEPYNFVLIASSFAKMKKSIFPLSLTGC